MSQTILIIMFIALFAAMSVIFALAAITGYTVNKDRWERAVSLCIGLLCSAGFARLAYESGTRL